MLRPATKGRFFEVTPGGTVVWGYQSPVFNGTAPAQGTEAGDDDKTMVFRADRYAPDDERLAGLDLTSQGPVELPEGTVVGPPEPTSCETDEDCQVAGACPPIASSGCGCDSSGPNATCRPECSTADDCPGAQTCTESGFCSGAAGGG